MTTPNTNQTDATATDSFDISETSYKTTHTAVRKARRFTLQGLYEWLMTDRRFATIKQDGEQDQTDNLINHHSTNAPHDIAARTRATNAMHTVHLGYYHELMWDIPKQIDELEGIISRHLDRDINRLDMVERVVLLIGAYELKHSLHIPYKVVIDEAMKLNTHFGATDAHKLINAVMDRMAGELRAVEIKADKQASEKSGKQEDKQDQSKPDTVDDD